MRNEFADAGIKRRLLGQQIVAGRFRLDDLVAWRHQVRLDHIVVVLDARRVGVVPARRTAGAIGTNTVITPAVGAKCIDRADRYRKSRDPRRMDSTEYLVSIQLAVISGSRANH